MKFSAIFAVVFMYSIVGVSYADWQKTTADYPLPGMKIALYDKPTSGAKIINKITEEELGPEIWYLQTSKNRMHNIKIDQKGPTFWVKGTVVRLPKIEIRPVLKCETVALSSPGNSGKGLGNETDCKDRN